jgi:hypothetical protein
MNREEVADLIATLDEERQVMRARWRRERRARRGAWHRRVIRVYEPPGVEDFAARWLWAAGAQLLLLGEAAVDRAVSVECNSRGVLERYIAVLRKTADRLERALAQ